MNAHLSLMKMNRWLLLKSRGLWITLLTYRLQFLSMNKIEQSYHHTCINSLNHMEKLKRNYLLFIM